MIFILFRLTIAYIIAYNICINVCINVYELIFHIISLLFVKGLIDIPMILWRNRNTNDSYLIEIIRVKHR